MNRVRAKTWRYGNVDHIGKSSNRSKTPNARQGIVELWLEGYYSNNINNNYHVLSMCQALKYFVLLLLLLILSNTFMKNYYYAHFTEDEIKAKRLSKFQRNTPRK